MSLQKQMNLVTSPAFLARVQGGVVHTAAAIISEVTSEVQQVIATGSTAGTFTLTFDGQTTANISWNGSAGDVEVALRKASNIGVGNVSCSGGPLPATAVTITFAGTLASNPQPLISATSALTGGTATPSRVTAGASKANHAARAVTASKVMANSTGYAQVFAPQVADSLVVQSDFDGGSLTPVSPGVVQVGSTTNTSAVVTFAGNGVDTTHILKGQGVTGTGIPGGATVLSVDSTTQITLSASATATGSPSLTFAAFTVSEDTVSTDLDNQISAVWNANT